ncbi:hypothetical protein AMATHDRAFT_134385 [Amanita thiersii Skay4041]|uniref:Peptidase A1 domain-containing protein n=1 Tax=Amanita thiersii Skay4041 TaxID=703135 RepID=A0A2A9NV60_9AGAR|nr:hypothetical protein AMATHDRAFT_134385 [Amanita thiersii Skay4041]
MFHKSALLVPVTLALFTFANPLPSTQGASVPLRKRSPITRNGVFDHDRAVQMTVLTKNKHRQNLINLEHNLGKELFSEGAVIKPLASMPTAILDRFQKRQSESLTDEDEVEWAGTISVGTPGQRFLIDFDTGSSDLWVPSASCTDTDCSSKRRYDASSSSTSRQQSGNFSIQYGDGSTVSGPVVTDTVIVAGIKATGQFFSPVTTLSSSFRDDPVDGILGLAFPALSNLHNSPFFNTAHSQGSVPSNVFAFFLASKKSELFLGGVNKSLFTGSIEYHKLSSNNGFWQIGNAAISINSKKAVQNFQTIIDSGTTIMYGPPAAVKKLYEKLRGAKVFDSENGFYSFPCNSIPSVSFNWGGRKWAISSTNFNLGLTEEGSSDCVGAIAGQDLGLGKDVWLLGDSFMKNVYTVFDTDRNAVGFAALAA